MTTTIPLPPKKQNNRRRRSRAGAGASAGASAGPGPCIPLRRLGIVGLVPDPFHGATDNALLRDALSSASLDSIMPTTFAINRTFGVTLGRDVSAHMQARSGRCWIFSNVNALRRRLVQRNGWAHDFTLSSSFVYFYSMLEQCNTALEVYQDLALRGVRLGAREFTDEAWRPTDGGDVHSFVALIEKYGIVPRDAYPDTHTAQQTEDVGMLLRRTLRAAVLDLFPAEPSGPCRMSRAAFEVWKRGVLQGVHRTLCALLGSPPSQFRFVPRLQVEAGTKSFEAVSGVTKVPDRSSGGGGGGGSMGTMSTTGSMSGGRGAGVRGGNRPERNVSRVSLTPLEFYTRFVRAELDPDRIVYLSNDPRHARHTWIAPRRCVRVLDEGPDPDAGLLLLPPPLHLHLDDIPSDLYWNVGSATMKAAARAALRARHPVVFVCEMDQFVSRRLDYMGQEASTLSRLFPGAGPDLWTIAGTDASKARALDSGLLGANHAMTLIGYDDATDTWEVENSWGASKPLTMSDAWFDRFVYSLCVADVHLGPAEARILSKRGMVTLPTTANATANGTPLCQRS